MENVTNQSINEVLHSSSLLQDYISKTQSLTKLTQIIRQFLESELAKNCNVANFSNNELILATTSPAWNHKLRFLLPDLQSQLRNLPQFNKLAKIKIIQNVTNNSSKETVNQLKKITISSANVQHIKETAKTITNKKLADALIRMADKHQNDES